MSSAKQGDGVVPVRPVPYLHETDTVTRRDANRSKRDQARRHEFAAARVFFTHEGAKNDRCCDQRDHVSRVCTHATSTVPENATKHKATNERRHTS